MPLFQIDGEQLELRRPHNFDVEKQIQALVEKNLDAVFKCRFVATEFSTGPLHGGRIDSLALSEDNNPVIIEYKKVESSQLVNQSLYYLSWIQDHHGDFELEVQKALGPKVEVDWTDIRVICLAPGYKKFDIHAVQMMGANIELWQYRLFDGGALYLEEVFRRSAAVSVDVTVPSGSGKNPVMVEAGKKAAITRRTGSYTVEQHLERSGPATLPLVEQLRDFIRELDDSVEEAPKKYYVAYKMTQNFACMEVRTSAVTLYLKLDPSEFDDLPPNARDVRSIGHYGTGDFELTISSTEQAAAAEPLIRQAFDRIGG